MSTSTDAIAGRSLVPLSIVACSASAVSAVVLAAVAPPDLDAVSGSTVRAVTVGSLAVLAVLLPAAVVATRRARERVGFPAAVVHVVALLTNAVTLGDAIRQPLQGATSMIAMVASGVLVIVCLTTAVEDRELRAATSTPDR